MNSPTVIDDPPAPPQSVKAYKAAAKEITLQWQGPTAVNGYEIYLKEGAGKYKKLQEIEFGDAMEYKIKNLSLTGNYKIRMRSYKEIWGEMRYSKYTTVSVNMKKQPLLGNLSVSKSISLKTGQKKRIAVKCTKGTDSKYIKSVKYKVKDKKIATVKPSGVVIGKKKGRTGVSVRVVLKSGLSKSFTTELKVVK